MENACIHIYTGDGKGKTTAAVGLCHRCANRGFKVGMTSFLKDFDSGEYLGITPFDVFTGVPVNGFWNGMDTKEKGSIKEESRLRMRTVFQRAKEEDYDLIVLDEVLGAIAVGCIQEEELIAHLKNRPKKLEVVLTGRDPSKALCALADYISEIKAVKHPYTKGLGARIGIEK